MSKFKNIYIASDIDGTFLWDCGYVNPKNIEAVKYFTENGGHFAFSTGRNRFDTERVLPYWREICNMPCIFFTKESASATVDWLLNLADERVAIRTSALDVCKRYEVRYAPFGVIIDHKRRVLWFGNPTLLDRKQIEYIINNRKEICHLRK